MMITIALVVIIITLFLITCALQVYITMLITKTSIIYRRKMKTGRRKTFHVYLLVWLRLSPVCAHISLWFSPEQNADDASIGLALSSKWYYHSFPPRRWEGGFYQSALIANYTCKSEKVIGKHIYYVAKLIRNYLYLLKKSWPAPAMRDTMRLS